MKKILMIFAVSISFFACKKDSKDNENPKGKNTVTYTTNGSTYTVSENNSNTDTPPVKWVDSYVHRASIFTEFVLHVSGSDMPFNLYIDNMKGPASGIGTYILSKDGNVEEKFTGGQGYDIIGGTVSVTEASNTKVVGTYSVQLKNASSTKTATGTFNITDPAQ